MVIVFDFGAFHDLEPDGAEQRRDPLEGTGDGMDAATGQAAARQRDVESFGREPRFEDVSCKHRFARLECIRDRLPGSVQPATGLGPQLGRHRSERLRLHRNSALPPEEPHPCSVDLAEILGCGDLRPCFPDEIIDTVGHRGHPPHAKRGKDASPSPSVGPAEGYRPHRIPNSTASRTAASVHSAGVLVRKLSGAYLSDRITDPFIRIRDVGRNRRIDCPPRVSSLTQWRFGGSPMTTDTSSAPPVDAGHRGFDNRCEPRVRIPEAIRGERMR